jgi:hypothetical protein
MARFIRVEDDVFGIVEPSGKLFVPSVSLSEVDAWKKYVANYSEENDIAKLLELQKRGCTCEKLRIEHYDTVHGAPGYSRQHVDETLPAPKILDASSLTDDDRIPF